MKRWTIRRFTPAGLMLLAGVLGACGGDGAQRADGSTAPDATGGTDATPGAGTDARAGDALPPADAAIADSRPEGGGDTGGSPADAAPPSDAPPPDVAVNPADATAVQDVAPTPDAPPADGPPPDTAPAGCTGAAGAVCVKTGEVALFYSAAGALLHRGEVPSEFVLPSDGRVVAASPSAGSAELFVGVPAGVTLLPIQSTQTPTTEPRQSLRVDVPTHPSGSDIMTSNGCTGVVGTGPQVLTVDTSCLEDGKAHVLIRAGDQGFILISGIAVGAAGEAPLNVPVQTTWIETPRTTFQVDQPPSGFDRQRVGFDARQGRRSMLSIHFPMLPDGANATAQVALPPELGVEWFRHAYFRSLPPSTDRGTAILRSLGHPLPAGVQMERGADFLPVPEGLTVAGAAVTWSYADATRAGTADRTLVTVKGMRQAQSVSWTVEAPGGLATFSWPALPADLAGLLPESVQEVRVTLEDRLDLADFRAVLGKREDATVNDTVNEPPRRVAWRLFMP